MVNLHSIFFHTMGADFFSFERYAQHRNAVSIRFEREVLSNVEIYRAKLAWKVSIRFEREVLSNLLSNPYQYKLSCFNPL